MMLTGEQPSVDWRTAGFVAPRLAAAGLAGFGLVLVLRTGSASSWLARRRWQARGGSEGRGSVEQGG
jgi:hypothetical protein